MSAIDMPEVQEIAEAGEERTVVAYDTHESYILQREVDLDLAVLELDRSGAFGQIRPLQQGGVESRRRSLERNPPTDLLPVLVWPRTADGVAGVVMCSEYSFHETSI